MNEFESYSMISNEWFYAEWWWKIIGFYDKHDIKEWFYLKVQCLNRYVNQQWSCGCINIGQHIPFDTTI